MIAARVEAGSDADAPEARYVSRDHRLSDSDLPLAALESLYLGQAASTWKGVALGKCAFDWQLYAGLLWELKPLTIIDLGSWAGGSALFFADFAQMLVGDSFHMVVSLDITLKNVREAARAHPKVSFHECSTENIHQLFTPEFCSTLPHPWLVSEDAHYHLDKVLPTFHGVMEPGDYFICEDTSRQMHDWFEARNQERAGGEDPRTRLSIDALRIKTAVFDEFCRRYPDQYRCDSRYLDMFGYNSGKHWNSIIKRVR